MDQDLTAFQAALQTLSKDDVPAVFWTAFGWGSYINITRSEVSVVADLPKVIAMMEFVRQTEPTYYYGGPYLILGSIEGSMPQALGGKPEKAKEYFERAVSRQWRKIPPDLRLLCKDVRNGNAGSAAVRISS